jgi:hypothetical protein
MAPEPRNRVVILASLLAILLAVAAYQWWWARPSSVNAPASNERGRGQSANRTAAATPDAPVVHLPALGEERPKPVAGERNLFRFKPKAAPPAPPAPAPAPGPPAPPPNFNPQTTPPITLRYIGYVDRGPGRPKLVAFVDATGHPINCLEGGDCDGRYHIWHVGAESVEISYLDGTGRRTIRQGGG